MSRRNWLTILIFSLIFSSVFLAGCSGAGETVSPTELSAELFESLLPTSTAAPTQTPTATPTATPVPTLRRRAEALNFWIGSAVDPGWLVGNPPFAEVAAREYNMITPEVAMKFEVLHPEREYYDFTQADKVMAFAEENNMRVRGHTLVWWNQIPEWMHQAKAEGRFTRQDWIEILRGHIKTVVGYYRGRVYAWDVVNEAIGEDGTLFNNFWMQTIGPEYIPLAFQWAHEADPDAVLFYNDNGGEGMNTKSQGIYDMLSDLLTQGVPVHGVGLQTHTWLDGPPTAGELASNMQRLGELGLIVHITEMDVRTGWSSESEAQKLDSQAEMYRRVFTACLEAPSCEAFLTWGMSDRYSWLKDTSDQPEAPLLFDERAQPKPAYYAIMDTFEEYMGE